MDIQVRYTGSVEQFRMGLQKKVIEFFLFFHIHRKYGEKIYQKHITYRDRTRIYSSEGNKNLEMGNIKA